MLPPGVQMTVRARRRVLAQRAHGRVLDLGGADSHRSLWNRPGVSDVVPLDWTAAGSIRDRLAGLADAGERFDTVFSVFRLIAVPEVDGLLHQVGRVLDDDGEVLFLEPSRRRAPARHARRVVVPGVAVATGWHVERDIPAALRRARLSVTDLERHRISTVHWWLRSIVEGSAHHALEPHRGEG